MDRDDEGKAYIGTVTCPDCGKKHRFLADEWPEDCSCGYTWDYEEE